MNVECDSCHGSGRIHNPAKPGGSKCPRCNGWGSVDDGGKSNPKRFESSPYESESSCSEAIINYLVTLAIVSFLLYLIYNTIGKW